MGRLSAHLYFLTHAKSLISGVKAQRAVAKITFLKLLEGLKLDEFLKTPRTKKEIMEKIGEVKDTDLFNTFYNVLVKHFCKKWPGERIVLDEKRIKKIREIESTIIGEQFKPIITAASTVFPRVLKALFKKEEPRFTWAEISTTYYAQLKAPIYFYGRESVFRFANVKKYLKGKSLFIAGCGYGYEVEHVLKYLDGNIRIYAGDFFEEVIDIAKAHEFEFKGRRVALGELDNVDFILLDPEFKKPWDIEDETFDGVMAFAVIHWVKDQRKFIQEVARILVPGGLFFGATPLYKDHPDDIDVLFLKLQGGNRQLSIKEFYEYMEEAGFHKIDILGKAAFKAFKKVA